MIQNHFVSSPLPLGKEKKHKRNNWGLEVLLGRQMCPDNEPYPASEQIPNSTQMKRFPLADLWIWAIFCMSMRKLQKGEWEQIKVQIYTTHTFWFGHSPLCIFPGLVLRACKQTPFLWWRTPRITAQLARVHLTGMYREPNRFQIERVLLLFNFLEKTTNHCETAHAFVCGSGSLFWSWRLCQKGVGGGAEWGGTGPRGWRFMDLGPLHVYLQSHDPSTAPAVLGGGGGVENIPPPPITPLIHIHTHTHTHKGL